MTPTLPTYTWHDDLEINGQPYYTRHPAIHETSSDAYFTGLPDTTRQHLRAIHEASHAIAALAGHGHIHYAKIKTQAEIKAAARRDNSTQINSGDVFICNMPDGQANAVFLGAGERAEDRWLHQNHLWTASRAVGVELGAYGDRHAFLTTNPHFGFGADHNDYRVVHDLADQLVTRNWDAITTVADVLATRLHLTGAQIADLAQMANGTHSDTCTYAI